MALSGRINGTVSNKSNIFSFYIDWSATQDIAGNYSDVRTKVCWYATNTNYMWDTSATRNAWSETNGNRYSWSQRFDCNPWPSNPFIINDRTVRVYHNEDGTKTINISAYADGTASTYGPGISNASGTVILDPIARIPTAPTSCIATGRDTESYDAGTSLTITWSGAAGNITGYDLDSKICDKDTGVWGSWITIVTATPGTSFTGSMDMLPNTKYQYRVRACNGDLKSGYTESNILTTRGAIRINKLSSYKYGVPWLKVNGTWVKAKRVYIKINGAWKETI
jgi:hypothetical protein